MSSDRSSLAYRPCAGAVLINRAGLVFAGRRAGLPADDATAWQMPQGGIDAGEDIETAARRELWEETGIRSAELLAITDDWWSYDFPVRAKAGHKLYPFRGQTQRWAAFRFLGSDTEVTVSAEHTAEPAEFVRWAWRRLEDLPNIGALHRRAQYRRVAAAFAHLAGG